MPLVLVEVGGVARTGHLYLDRTGYSYEYPSPRYDRLITPGERFLYQTPGVGYVGCGIIGEIGEGSSPGRRSCRVHSVRMFLDPVGLRREDGSQIEADAAYWSTGKVFWMQGVRPLSEAGYQEVLQKTDTSVEITAESGVGAYADPSDAWRVESISVGAARAAIEGIFGGPTHVMHHNNPGFDIAVGDVTAPRRFVEVKGTRSSSPRFFMSEGERRFSARFGDKYTLVVVTGIDLADDSYEDVYVHHGEVNDSIGELRPAQWFGVLASGTGAA
jgi:hypothetical protein